MSVALSQIESSLSLFTEGIAGRFIHLKEITEFNPRLPLKVEALTIHQTRDSILLPAELEDGYEGDYRFLVMEQIGYRECGTFHFSIDTAKSLLPSLATREPSRKEYGPRTGEYQMLFSHFSSPYLAERLFDLLENQRIKGHLIQNYPGLTKHLIRYQHRRSEDEFDRNDLFQYAENWSLQNVTQLPNGLPRSWTSLLEKMFDLQLCAGNSDHSVYDTVTALEEIYDTIEQEYALEIDSGIKAKDESLLDWLGREERLEEWQEELEELKDQLNSQSSSSQVPIEEVSEAIEGAIEGGTTREIGLSIEEVKEEHDNLKRRIDMEKSSVQHALGADQKDSRSKRYDEWDYMNRRYLKAWCRVYEEKLLPEENVQIDELNQVIRQYQPLVQKQLEQIRPTGLERVKRVQDGDELDFNAIIEARQDIKAGKTPDERFYSRKERTNRDVCAIFLVDLSASTDDPIKPAEPKDWSGYDPEKEIDIRAGWYSALEEEEEPAGPPERKIIDLEKEAMVVMAAALDSLGDSYGIYGFSGYSKDNVELFVAKEPEDKFSNQTLQNIASLKPKGSTRMGPAIRHANQKLCSSGSAMKVMIMISDGFPQDCDYGPERGNHDYGVEDTAKALIEAQQKGIETFCVTVDKSGHDYLKRMCPDSRYMVIEEIEDLPKELSKLYSTLTGQ